MNTAACWERCTELDSTLRYGVTAGLPHNCHKHVRGLSVPASLSVLGTALTGHDARACPETHYRRPLRGGHAQRHGKDHDLPMT